MSYLYSSNAVCLLRPFIGLVVTFLSLTAMASEIIDPSPALCVEAVQASQEYVTSHIALANHRLSAGDISELAHRQWLMELNDQRQRIGVDDCMLSDEAGYALYQCLIDNQGAYKHCRI